MSVAAVKHVLWKQIENMAFEYGARRVIIWLQEFIVKLAEYSDIWILLDNQNEKD